MKAKRWISILCCIMMLFSPVGNSSFAAESESAASAAEISLEGEMILHIKNGETETQIAMVPMGADETVLVAAEPASGALQDATITGNFSASVLLTAAHPLYPESQLWSITKQPDNNDGNAFEIKITSGRSGAFALFLTAKDSEGKTKDYTLVFEQRAKCTDPVEINLLDAAERVEIDESLHLSAITTDTSRINFYQVSPDVSSVTVQVYRDLQPRDPLKYSVKWMMADQNWVSLNGAPPVRFDSAGGGNNEACSTELSLKHGVNVISVFFHNTEPKIYAFNNNDSRGIYLDNYRRYGFENFIYLIDYNGEEKEQDSERNNGLLSSLSITQFTAVNGNPEQKTYPCVLLEDGYEHGVALPETMPVLEDKRYFYGAGQNIPIKHETIVLSVKTSDPYAKAELVDEEVTAPDGTAPDVAAIYDKKNKTTSASISMIDGQVYGEQYIPVNVWGRNQIQLRVTAQDGSQKIPTVKFSRASSNAEITALNFNRGTLASETSKDVTFSPGSYEYYLDLDRSAADADLQITVDTADGASLKVDGKAVPSGTIPIEPSLPLHKVVVTAADGITEKTYLFLTRFSETDLPLFDLQENTRAAAKNMLKGWNSRPEFAKKDLSANYWELYKTIAAMDPNQIISQGDVLKALQGSYVYDITKHNYRQATDYAAVILELIMLGENPYSYKGVDYVAGMMHQNENGSFGSWGNNIWALMALKAAGAEIPTTLIDTVKSQAMSSSFDLDMRGWAMAAAAEYMPPLEIAKWAESIKSTQRTAGTDAGMFKHPLYNSINTMTHTCVMTGIAGAGIDVQTDFFAVNGTVTPLSALKDEYMTEDGQFYYSRAGFPSYSKDVIVALGDVIHGSNVWQRYVLTGETYDALLTKAESMNSGTEGSAAERERLKEALIAAKNAQLTSGGAITGLGDEYYALYEAMAAMTPDMKADVISGSPLDIFTKMISGLPEADMITSADKGRLETVRDYYEGLPVNYQEMAASSVLLKYRSCQGALLKMEAGEAAKQAFEQILALPDALVITLKDKVQVKEARNFYDALTAEGKSAVRWTGASVLSKLTAAEEMIGKLEDPATPVKTTTVTFSLLGGVKHGGSKRVYIYAKNPDKFDKWIPPVSYTFNSASVSVYRVFMRAINEYGLDQVGAQGKYVSAIMGPKGEWLKEFDNGPDSGWMYVVNGTHPQVSLQDCNVSNGDEIIWHYTDDYTQEEGSEKWNSPDKIVDANKRTETISLEAKTDASGKAAAIVSVKDISAALTKVLAALNQADKDGKRNITGEIKLEVKASGRAAFVETTVPAASVKEIAKAGKITLTAETPAGTLSFDEKALRAIASNVKGSDITIAVGKADRSKLSEARQKAAGKRPLFEVSLTSGGQAITDFDGGKVTVSLPYTLASGETAADLCLYFMGEKEELIQVEGSGYDEENSMVTFTTGHFSYYLIGYRPKDRFRDVTKGQWFYDNIMYLAGKGILRGKTETTFLPNDSITRAEFIQILYGMAMSESGVADDSKTAEAVSRPSKEGFHAFSDVPAATWYAKAAAWAYENSIAAGMKNFDGTVRFEPNARISRQDMSVMIKNYTEHIVKKEIPAAAAASSVNGSDSGTAESSVAFFQDKADIAPYAKDAVVLMQQGGIINGIEKKNQSGEAILVFSPNNHATRAEAATMIAKLLKVL